MRFGIYIAAIQAPEPIDEWNLNYSDSFGKTLSFGMKPEPHGTKQNLGGLHHCGGTRGILQMDI